MSFHQKVKQMLELGFGCKYLGEDQGLIFYLLPDGDVVCSSEVSLHYYLENGEKRKIN